MKAIFMFIVASMILIPIAGAVEYQDYALSDLLNMEVFSVSRKAEKLFTAPAAVYVITNEDIRRCGHTNIPDLLRMVPGIEVAQINANMFAVTARGSNGRYASKLLVQVDGRTIYTHLHSGVYWEMQDLVFEDLERIEVIRGPGATLWGANAVNGIINIITKSAVDTDGLYIDALYGDKEQEGNIRWSGEIREAYHYRIYGKYIKKDEQLDFNKDQSHDDLELPRGGFRCDFDLSEKNLITFQGDYYKGYNGQNYTGSSTTGNTVDFETDLQGFNSLLRYEHIFSDTTNLSWQMYYDRSVRRDEKLEQEIDIYDIDFQYNIGFIPHNNIVWGLGFRLIKDDITKVSYTGFTPPQDQFKSYSGFIQDRIMILPDLFSLTIGTKIEKHYYTGYEWQPSARILYTPHKDHTLWASVSHAVQTPTRIDHSIEIAIPMGPPPPTIILKGNPDLDSENVIAYEWGYRTHAVKDINLDIAGYYNVYDQTVNIINEDFATTFINENSADTFGIEISTRWNSSKNFTITGSYSFLHSQYLLSPKHQFHIQTCFDLPANINFDTGLHYVDSIKLTENSGVPSYYRMDLRLGWFPLEDLELSFFIRNLLVLQDGKSVNQHNELIYNGPDSGLIERSFYVKVAYNW